MTTTDGSAWPIERHHWLHLAVALVVSVAVFATLGYALTDLFAPNFVTRFDVEAAERLAASRTPRLDDVAHWAALLADTPIKIAVTAVFGVIAFALWRRWHEPAYLAVTLLFEALVFIIVTTIVGRSRPDVPQLEDSPVDSSFPSGHVAAAAVYGAFVVIVFWHTRARWARALATVVYLCVVVGVSWARLYDGMHFVSDVAAGVVLGVWSLVVCLMVIGRPERNDRTATPSQGEHGADPIAQQRVDDGEVASERPVADEPVGGRLYRP